MKKIVLGVAAVAAGLWLWTNHATTATGVCVAPPVQVCVERPPATTAAPTGR